MTSSRDSPPRPRPLLRSGRILVECADMRDPVRFFCRRAQLGFIISRGSLNKEDVLSRSSWTDCNAVCNAGHLAARVFSHTGKWIFNYQSPATWHRTLRLESTGCLFFSEFSQLLYFWLQNSKMANHHKSRKSTQHSSPSSSSGSQVKIDGLVSTVSISNLTLY